LPQKPIQFVNRYTGKTEAESVYGESFIRWTYEGTLGRLALHLLVKRALFSRWYGMRMKRPQSRSRIAPFINRYGILTEEFLEEPHGFTSFNDFFVRRLKQEARAIHPSPTSVVFPADGRHMGFQDVSSIRGVFVKGQQFDLDLLLMNAELANRYRSGSLVLSRLCPVDYHRFHFPCDGLPGPAMRINGPLSSVSPIALRQKLEILWTNRRVLTPLDAGPFGQVLLIEIGATCVGSIRQSFEPGRPVSKGQEKGWFEFGGSSTITLFEKGRIKLAEDLVRATGQSLELYAHMGDLLGILSHS